jgi:3D (Asp-Asp-Asp) domain-containing protein
MEYIIGALLGLNINFEIITADVTQYTKLETCPYHQCQTASGRYIDANDTDVIACPRKYKLGSRVIIDGKEYVCEDRTAQSIDRLGRFDIWAGDDYNGAMKWGVQRKQILIYNK